MTACLYCSRVQLPMTSHPCSDYFVFHVPGMILKYPNRVCSFESFIHENSAAIPRWFCLFLFSLLIVYSCYLKRIGQCFKTTQEFRHLSDKHTNHEDKLQVLKMLHDYTLVDLFIVFLSLLYLLYSFLHPCFLSFI